MLMFGSAAVIQVLKFGSSLVLARRMGRRAQLRAEGKCHVCGYDMTGLEFNERCPECGQIVW
jgi:predicted Zn-ribbon and HTH transcriptional regulator